ncbi:hypothetical protein PCASD_04589 [Puccinia coronata f. sp. avenae]|uniref:Uncharacterized protein n=1 Tax=Puccinia coronata f. sp. avenae TaxID=200324 RepID=A0A2N5V577_9BASI|nr:hypothetical protein PCASD_04589 [Puccinia coronata f. sp. avenae]
MHSDSRRRWDNQQLLEGISQITSPGAHHPPAPPHTSNINEPMIDATFSLNQSRPNVVTLNPTPVNSIAHTPADVAAEAAEGHQTAKRKYTQMTGDDAAHHNDAGRKERTESGISRTTCCKDTVAKTGRTAAEAQDGTEASRVPHGQRSTSLINRLSDSRSSIAARISDTHAGTHAPESTKQKASR